MSGIDCVASVGAGRMGRGIALSFAFAGLPVRLIDLKPRAAGESERLFADARALRGCELDACVVGIRCAFYARMRVRCLFNQRLCV